MADHDTGTLETLTSTLQDSINGYREAAEHAQDSRLKQVFDKFARDRSEVAGELGAEIRRLGGTPPENGSFLGKTHQVFLDLKSAITGRNDKAIVNEVERGEDYLKEKFEAALNATELAPESRSIIERAYQSVRQGHDQISDLKHGLEV
ncbi:ferritin-like domain-containing protein [Sphingomonas ginkgonis]|nr:PA2169 family four-helix-bundle protein [Sphingomonas ginkgonis]